MARRVFTTRTRYDLGIVVGERSGIESPADLRGRKIGVPEYQQTSAVWSRGVLQHDFGVDPADVHWVMERGAAHSHGAATDFRPPEGVRVDVMSPEENIGTLLAEDYLAGSLLYLSEKNLVDRSPERSEAELRDPPAVLSPRARTRPLPRRWHRAARHALRRRAPGARRGVAVAGAEPVFGLHRGQGRGAGRGRAELRTVAVAGSRDRGCHPRARRDDPVPYGMEANRTMLDRLRQYVVEQGIAVREVPLDEVFAPQTLDL